MEWKARAAAALTAGTAVVGIVTLGCTSAPAPQGPPATAARGTATTAGVPALSTTPVREGAASRAVDRAAPQLVLTDEQRACVVARLERDGALVAALGDDPLGSPRYGELARIGGDCINAVTFSAEWARALQASADGALSESQLACARTGISELTSEEVQVIVRAGLDPATADPTMAARLDAIIAGCGIDRARLAPVGVDPPP